MSGKRFALRILVPAMFGVCLTAAAAWACTGGPTRYDIAPTTVNIGPKQSDPLTETVRVTGENFGGPVEIRWNTLDGEVLGTASGGNFAVDVPLPKNAKAGVYYLVAVQKDQTGTVVSKLSEVIELTGSRSASGARATSGPSGRSASQDFWSSLARSESGDVGPSLATEPSNRSSLLAGVALAGAGLLSLVSVLAIAAASRRSRKSLG